MSNQISNTAAILMLVCSRCCAQTQYRFQHFDTNDGLGSQTVPSINQDSLGFLWFQHPDGLSRFDGYSFKVYKYNLADSFSSPDTNNVGRLLKDSHGNIWIFQNLFGLDEEGHFELITYDRKTDGFIRYPTSLDAKFIWRYAICFDKKQPLIWLGGQFSFSK